MSPGAVVVGGYVNGLTVTRSLARRGVPVAVVETQPFDIAGLSRYTGLRLRVDLHRRPDSLLELLRRRAGAWSGWAVYPTNDEALSVLGRHFEELSRSYRLVAPPPEVGETMIRKDRMRRAAEAVGVELPRLHGDARTVGTRLAERDFPVVVKPVESHRFGRVFGAKLFVARNREELEECTRRTRAAGLEAQILDLVPGGDDRFYNYCVYMDLHGEPVAGMAMHKLRKSPPFYGVCRVAETSDAPGLREPTVELLRRIGYRGMANAEYKLDPRDGRYRLMEVNGRPFLMQGLAGRAGLDLPHLFWRERVQGERVAGRPNGWQGVWIHLHADLLYALFQHRVEGLGLRDYLAPYRRPKAFAVWDGGDPRPFAAQWARSARTLLRGGWRAGGDANPRPPGSEPAAPSR